MIASLKNENDISIIVGDPFNMEYLKPPAQDVQQINHNKEYIYHVDAKGNHNRSIFYNQEFNEFEKSQILEYRNLLKENNVHITLEWSDLKILKYIYNEQFKKNIFLTQIQKHILWLNNAALQNPSEETLQKYLKEGIIYTFGRDKLYRPLVFVNCSRIKADSTNIDEMNAVNGSLCRLLSIIQKNMFVEGKVENWIICIDTNNLGLLEIDFKVIAKIVECMVANYTCILHKLLILNPSWSFRQCWKIISTFIPTDTQKKIDFFTKDEFYKIQEMGVNPEQIEKKYGGSHENLTNYWPPINTFKHRVLLEEHSQNDSSYYHSMIDHSNFQQQHHIQDQDKTQDQINHHTQNILDDKLLYDHKDDKINKKTNNSLVPLKNQLEQPHPQSSGFCCRSSNSNSSCQIF